MTKKITVVTLCIMLLLLVSGFAQKKNLMTPHASTQFKCEDCHVCKNPTASNPCLRSCPRFWLGVKEDRALSLAQGPDVVVMDELEALYVPVKFAHRLHAEMAEISQGCTTCHHYSPTASLHPPCKDCHSSSVIHENIKQPGLKGAYHRLCMGCHREWSNETACEACHIAKANLKAAAAPTTISPYLPCQEPETKTYHISYNQGPYVSFFHYNHAHLYGLNCSDCHKEDPCVACHYQGEKPVSVVEAHADLMHHKCSACHDITSSTSCSKCHSEIEKKGFDHGKATGWTMNIYHQKLSCRSCHPAAKKIAKLDNSCNSCHSGWKADNFNHAVTGIELDETHLEADCADCHENRQFDKAPICSTCHEGEKTYPKDKPGKVTKKGK